MVEERAGMVILLGSAMDKKVVEVEELRASSLARMVKAKLVLLLLEIVKELDCMELVLGVKAETWLQLRTNKSALLESFMLMMI